MRPSDLLRTGLLTTLAAAASSAPAQDPVLDRQVVASTGDEAIGTGIALEFTLGDLVVYTDLGTQGAPFTQGFHQLTDDPTGTAEMATTNDRTAYPNPTANRVRIEWGSTAKGMGTVILYDALGKRLHTERVNLSLAYACDLSPFAVGAYLVRCMPDNGQVISMPVQKAR